MTAKKKAQSLPISEHYFVLLVFSIKGHKTCFSTVTHNRGLCQHMKLSNWRILV